jgi:hypothetical protein
MAAQPLEALRNQSCGASLSVELEAESAEPTESFLRRFRVNSLGQLLEHLNQWRDERHGVYPSMSASTLAS